MPKNRYFIKKIERTFKRATTRPLFPCKILELIHTLNNGLQAEAWLFNCGFFLCIFIYFKNFRKCPQRLKCRFRFDNLFCNFNIFNFNLFVVSDQIDGEQIRPLDSTEIRQLLDSRNLVLTNFARFPIRIKKRSYNYLSQTLNVALFYSIPVVQLVVTYQRVRNFYIFLNFLT